MPPKFKYSDDRLHLIQNDRGEWHEGIHSTAGDEFIGFDGENMLTIIVMGMQSGDYDAVVVHSSIDSPSRVGQSIGKNVDVAVNEAVEQVCDYPNK